MIERHLSFALLGRAIALAAAVIMLQAGVAHARQWPSGNVSILVDFLPEHDETLELRTRVFVEKKFEPRPFVRINLSGFAEGLLADRSIGASGKKGRVTDAIVRALDTSVELTAGNVEVLAGYARIVWGRLDEIQPTDVVNPLDASRFFFEGRSEARLPVAVVRTRVFFSDESILEGVYVPVFRRGRFDQLDEPTSPFNLTSAVGQDQVVCLVPGCPALPPVVDRRAPPFTVGNAQGGVRFATTSGRLDWSLSAFRGFEPFGVFVLGAPASAGWEGQPDAVRIDETYPRFTMIGGDFEAVWGPWGLRGEAAVFPEDTFQSANLTAVAGSSFDGGVGVDRRAGQYTVSATVLMHREAYDDRRAMADPDGSRFDVSLVGSADRAFGREKYRLRTFGVMNLSEASGFLRSILFVSLRDNLVLEGSIGLFIGEGPDLVGRFERNDFGYLRLKYHF